MVILLLTGRLALLEQSQPTGGVRDLSAVVDVQLAHDVAHVELHRALAHEDRLADLPVGETLGDQPDHFALPIGEGGDPVPGRRRGGARGEPTYHGGAATVEAGLTARNGADDPDQLAHVHVLQHVGLRAAPEGLGHQLLVEECGEHHDAGPRTALEDLAADLKPIRVAARAQLEVEQHDLGACPLDRAERVGWPPCLPDDGDVLLELEDRPQAAAHDRVVVHYEDAHARRDRQPPGTSDSGGSSGAVTSSRMPPPRRGAKRTRAASSLARSAMFARPRW